MYKKRKKCFLCDTLIYYNRAACKDHAELYNQYKDEQWCKELVKSENKQGIIESRESVSLYSLSSTVLSSLHTEISIKDKSIDSNQIINLYQSGMKPIDISNTVKVNYKTVRSILYRYRRKCMQLQ